MDGGWMFASCFLLSLPCQLREQKRGCSPCSGGITPLHPGARHASQARKDWDLAGLLRAEKHRSWPARKDNCRHITAT